MQIRKKKKLLEANRLYEPSSSGRVDTLSAKFRPLDALKSIQALVPSKPLLVEEYPHPAPSNTPNFFATTLKRSTYSLFNEIR